MELSTLDNGDWVIKMVKGRKSGQMGLNMRGIIKMVKNMEKGLILGMMVLFILVTGKMEKFMDLER